MIKVYNRQTTQVESIGIENLDLSKHFHRNTHEAFTKEDLELFWYKEKAEVKTEIKPQVKTKTK